MRRKKSEEQEAPARGDGRISPADVQEVEFRLAFRGYSERDVDAFLDRITADLTAYIEENDRLRAGAGLTPLEGGGVDEARREAAAIVAKAREEAAAIVRGTASTGAGTPAPMGDARTAVAPFLNTEREFLQALGSLVQGHAEEIKQMVMSVRARAESAPAPAAERRAPEPAPEPRSEQVPPPPEAATPGAREQQGDGPQPESAPEPSRVVVEDATEPAYSSEGAAGEARERSLRELFWGEE